MTGGHWLNVSARTGRRRLAALLEDDPALTHAIEHTHAVEEHSRRLRCVDECRA